MKYFFLSALLMLATADYAFADRSCPANIRFVNTFAAAKKWSADIDSKPAARSMNNGEISEYIKTHRGVNNFTVRDGGKIVLETSSPLIQNHSYTFGLIKSDGNPSFVIIDDNYIQKPLKNISKLRFYNFSNQLIDFIIEDANKNSIKIPSVMPGSASIYSEFVKGSYRITLLKSNTTDQLAETSVKLNGGTFTSLFFNSEKIQEKITEPDEKAICASIKN